MTSPTHRSDRIYIAGFMGSGKSTVGPILANTIGYEFGDLDRTIEQREGLPVTAIFQTNGEAHFRSLEHQVVLAASTRQRFVLALGGGTLGHPASLELITATGILVYLRLGLDLLVKRLQQKQDRPMLMDTEGNRLPEPELRERIRELLARREPLYRRADVTIEMDDRRVGITVDRLVQALQPFLR
jgi:shikimate kinase